MKERLKLHRLWLGTGWLLVGLVVYLTLIPQPPDITLGIHVWDKLSHFLAYGFLMGWFVQIYHTTTGQIWLVLLLVLLGVMLEVFQDMGGIRTMEFTDMIANTLGVLSGWFLGKTRFAYMLQKLEQLVIK